MTTPAPATPSTPAPAPAPGQPPAQATDQTPNRGPGQGPGQSGGPGPRPGGYQNRGPRPGGYQNRGGRPRGRYAPRRRVCSFCVEHVKNIDYKDYERLRRFVSDRAKIEPRRKSGVCAKHQRALSTAIKRARHLALLPFVPMQTMRSGIRR